MLVAAVTLWGALTGTIESDPTFQEAERLYASLEYEQAIIRFEEVSVRPGLDKPDKARALLWVGLSYAGTADFDSARRIIKEAIEADPAVALPDKVSPRVVTLFHDLQAEVAKEPPPPPPPKPPPPKAARASTGFVVGAVTGGVGVLALASGAAFGVLSALDYDQAQKSHFQSDAKAHIDATNFELITAAILLPAGVIAGAIGTTLIVVNSGNDNNNKE